MISMPRWTSEQQEAIDREGTNIIVSAGAGSGKTAVLSERALRKVKNGIDIDRLLILTFTKAAAYEMMLRIRKKIKEAGYLEQVEKIEKAYITTFDSFALSIVKKYHTELNISKDVSIIDASVISLVKKEKLEQIFLEYYEKKDTRFNHFISDFCIKDDRELKESILKINEKLDMKYDKKEYLENYLTCFEKEKIEQAIKEYEKLLKNETERIFKELDKIRLEVDGDYYDKLYQVLSPLLESRFYNEYKESTNIKLPQLPRGSSDTVKKSKEQIGKIIDSIRDKCIYENKEEIVETILSTKDYIEIIIKIISQLDERVNEYKQKNDIYEFVDISKLAIKVVKENSKIRNELRDFFKEIMIDEYQDTSDLQEIFINLIENNNVYMVGDIKQSIYRFRNANPYIFKEKYDQYSKGIGGYKIDLVKNFRSRKEVLEDINHIFDLIMDDNFGGADYSVSHRMVFGNTAYIEEGKTEQSYKTEIYNYTYDKTCEYTKDEVEAFLIANDINEKVKAHYQVFDKDNKILRDITYQDFAILVDKSSNFELYKKIFEYKKVPLNILKNENIMNNIEIYLVNNLVTLLLKGKCHEFDTAFKYAFLSIGRSYLFEMTDQELFDILNDKSYQETELYKIIEPFFEQMDQTDIETLLSDLIEKIGFYTKLIKVGNVEIATNNLEYIIKTASTLKKIGYTLEDFSTYLTKTIESDAKIEIPQNSEMGNSVQIMTIHKSKGLEYHICYFPGLGSRFNVSDLKEKILYDNTYGIITPYFKEGYGDTIYKSLLKDKFYTDEISEKIRLFYVALTRCKEKMILIADLSEEDDNVEDGKVEDNRRLKYRSFLEFLKSIYEQLTDYIKEIDLKDIPMSLDYKLRNSENLTNLISKEEKVVVEENRILEVYEQEGKFSKIVTNLVTKEEQESMKFGTKIHENLEYLDLKNPNFEGMEPFIAQKIKAFLNQERLKNIENATIYKEYEFIENEGNIESHGIIDLMLVYDDYIDIIDYKLKKIDSDSYKKQLEGYQSYIQRLTNKKTNIYLYSILDEKLFEL